VFGQHQAGIVGRVHQHRGQGFIRPYALAGAQPDARLLGVGRVVADAEHRIGLPVRVEHHQRGQKLGQGRRSAAHVDIAAPQQLAVQYRGVGRRGSMVGIVAVDHPRVRGGGAEDAQQQHGHETAR
jgi:hypothetical protein